MSVVNLNKVRKEKSKAEQKAQADANAASFGRTKAARILEAANAALANKRHADHKFEDE